MLIVRPIIARAGVASSTTPTIASFGVAETQAVLCGVNWQATASWIIDNPDNVNYYINVRNGFGGGLIAGNQDCASGDYVYTGNTGDPLFSGYTQVFSAYIEICRRSDNVPVQTSSTESASTESGAPC